MKNRSPDDKGKTNGKSNTDCRRHSASEEGDRELQATGIYDLELEYETVNNTIKVIYSTNIYYVIFMCCHYARYWHYTLNLIY